MVSSCVGLDSFLNVVFNILVTVELCGLVTWCYPHIIYAVAIEDRRQVKK